MGLWGEINHPEVERKILEALATCQQHDVPCVGMATTQQQMRQRVEQGFRIVLTGPAQMTTILGDGQDAAQRRP
jgi:2-keto-3-deoxy-L-rhamnonate aldolase RhmA